MPTKTLEKDRIPYEEALLAARLAGRHGKLHMLNHALEAGDLEGDQILRALDAYQAGQKERTAGIPCLCIDCRTNTTQLVNNEMKRQIYRERRTAELTANGATWSDVQHIIDREIADGMAF